MTKEEAIDILVGVIATNSEEENEALDMAIEALQRTSNTHPTHECVEPTHECVEPVGNSDTLKGKWNVYEVANTEEEQPIAWECSECGEVVEVQYNFCPNCGADMRGEQNE